MSLSETPLTLSPEQVAAFEKGLSMMRHNVNNHLSLIVAACELMRRKPEIATRLIENILQQPERISKEISLFSETAEATLRGKIVPPATN